MAGMWLTAGVWNQTWMCGTKQNARSPWPASFEPPSTLTLTVIIAQDVHQQTSERQSERVYKSDG